LVLSRMRLFMKKSYASISELCLYSIHTLNI